MNYCFDFLKSIFGSWFYSSGTSQDYPNKNLRQKMVSLLCPCCVISSIGMLHAATCGSCKKCNAQTPWYMNAYCDKCSIILNSCYQCGKVIKDGNAYLVDIEQIVKKRIDEEKRDMQQDIERDNGRLSECYMEMIEIFSSELIKARDAYFNKTADEMRYIIMEYQRKRYH
jgi:hypothetical protein